MELDFNRKEKIVGTFVICITVLLLTTVIVIGRGKNWFKTYTTFYTIFDQSYNLEVDTPVKLFNADIGKIKQIDLVGDKVKIKLAILHEFRSRIRATSRATVESPTFFGSEHIAIIPGEEDSPLIQEEGIIPSKKKKSIADYLEEFEVEKTAKMIVKAVQEFSKVSQVLLDPQGPLFTAVDTANQTLAHAEKITRGIEHGQGTVGALLKSKVLLEQTRASLNEVSKILEHISQTSAKAPAAMDQVQQNLATLSQIEKGVLVSVPNVQRIVNDIEEAVRSLKTILANVEKGSHDIPQVTRSTAQGIQEIRAAVENIDKVLQALQNNFLIRSNLPPTPEGKNVDAGLRQ